MDDDSRFAETPFEWHPCSLILPRIALLQNRNGMHMRLLLPGAYLVRQSRSLGKRIYRRLPAQDRQGWDD